MGLFNFGKVKGGSPQELAERARLAEADAAQKGNQLEALQELVKHLDEDRLLVLRAALRVVLSVLLVVTGAALLVLALPFHEITSEIATRVAPTALDLLVAVFCALTAAYTTVRPGSDTTAAAAGTAIGIALVPPLCTVGFGQRVRPVECVVETAPARVGGVERVARVADRNHQLRPGPHRDFLIDIRGRHHEIGPVRHQIADLTQHGLIRHTESARPGPALMPCIQTPLQVGALGQEGRVARAEPAQ